MVNLGFDPETGRGVCQMCRIAETTGQTTHPAGWMGVSVMKWDRLHQTIQYQMLNSRHYNAIILHIGGNDIMNNKQIDIIKAIQTEINYIVLHSFFPSLLFVWC